MCRTIFDVVHDDQLVLNRRLLQRTDRDLGGSRDEGRRQAIIIEAVRRLSSRTSSRRTNRANALDDGEHARLQELLDIIILLRQESIGDDVHTLRQGVIVSLCEEQFTLRAPHSEPRPNSWRRTRSAP